MASWFKNPWAASLSEILNNFYPNRNNNSSDNSLFGGEVTNETNEHWAVSGISNSNTDHFAWLPPGKNSDSYAPVEKKVDGEVDAIWPLGQKNHLGSLDGQLVTNGAIKIKSHQNANIRGNIYSGYFVIDYWQYFPSNSLPNGWMEPKREDIK